MSIKIVPVSQLALRNGAKVLLYGPPGTSKTPMVAQLPRALMACCETGLSSVKTMSTPSVATHEFKLLDGFLKWCFSASPKELDKYDTFVFDSLTQLCNIVLEEKKKRNKHGLKAYGEMLDYVIGAITLLCRMPNKNIVFTAQMVIEDVPKPGGFGETYKYQRPLFPGQKLHTEIPHWIDEIWFVHNCRRPDNSFGPAISTTDTGTAMARSRCGKLSPLEPADLNYLFNKMNA